MGGWVDSAGLCTQPRVGQQTGDELLSGRVFVSGEWAGETVGHTPSSPIHMTFTPRDPTVGSAAIHILLCCSSGSVSCVTALRYACETRVPLRKENSADTSRTSRLQTSGQLVRTQELSIN